MHMKKIKWGVLGCGHISNTFMTSIEAVDCAEVAACAARDGQRAKSFANKYGIKSSYGSYDEMLADRSIHAVYIATTHNFHFEHIMLSLRNGKHVLCEKPLTLNVEQANKAFKLANEMKLLLVEGVWTRFLPAILTVQELIQQGEIGKVQALHANFSLNRDLPTSHRLLNLNLAGGALLDLGIYPLTIADIVFNQEPKHIHSSFIRASTGVDLNSFYTLHYTEGQTALLSAGSRMSGQTFAEVMGEKGRIFIPNFLAAQSFTLHQEGQPEKEVVLPFEQGHNFTAEISSFSQALLHDLNHFQAHPERDNIELACKEMPEVNTLRILGIMDTIRRQWGLIYPDE